MFRSGPELMHKLIASAHDSDPVARAVPLTLLRLTWQDTRVHVAGAVEPG